MMTKVTFSGLILPTVEAGKEVVDWTKLTIVNLVGSSSSSLMESSSTLVESSSNLIFNLAEKGVSCKDFFINILTYLGTTLWDQFAGVGIFFADTLLAFAQYLHENGLALGQLVVQSAEGFVDFSFFILQDLVDLGLSIVNLFFSFIDLLLTPVKDLAFLFSALFEYMRDIFSHFSIVVEYLSKGWYMLKENVNDLFLFMFDILNYFQQPVDFVISVLKDTANSLLISTSDFVSYVKHPLADVWAVLIYIRSLFAMLPVLLKDLISCIVLVLVYLRQFIADLPTMLLKWDRNMMEKEEEVNYSMVNSFLWGKGKETQAPRLISQMVKKWWTTG